jgi:tetratricopeptide (TPR) repeat protein
MRRRSTLFALAIAVFCGSGIAIAQTPAVDLDRLFAQLRDAGSEASARGIESRIWDAWMHGGNELENEALSMATEAMNKADYAKAEQLLNALTVAAEKFSEAYNKRATLYFLMGRYEDSLADIVKTLDLEPRHFGALSGRAMIMQGLGRNAEAIVAYKEALSINPNMVSARAAILSLEKQAPEL